MKKGEGINSIALIMDGNRRWAVKNNLIKTEGHKEGLKTLLKTIDWIKDLEIDHVTFYAFSSENWKRPKIEVDSLMMLFEEVFIKKIDLILEKKVSIKFIGSLDKFSKKMQKEMSKIEKNTQQYTTKVFIAVSYGGRDEIIQAVKNISKSLSQEEIHNIDEKIFENYLQSSDIPEPEIIIRTGGSKRLSNFLLWKSAYSEIFFIDKLWPDFCKKDLSIIVEKYKKDVKINKGK
jgi:undecaprenyl diphosphate synthase